MAYTVNRNGTKMVQSDGTILTDNMVQSMVQLLYHFLFWFNGRPPAKEQLMVQYGTIDRLTVQYGTIPRLYRKSYHIVPL